MKDLYFKSIAVFGFLASTSLQADTVVMKNLESLQGDLIKDTPDWVELRVEYGTLKIPREKILRIEADSPEMLAEREAKAAREKELTDQMLAEGKVKYHGKWVTPQEKAAEEAKIAEAKRRKLKEIAAALKKAAEALALKLNQEKQQLEQEAAQAQVDAQSQKQKDQLLKQQRNNPYRPSINSVDSVNGQTLQQLQQN